MRFIVDSISDGTARLLGEGDCVFSVAVSDMGEDVSEGDAVTGELVGGVLCNIKKDSGETKKRRERIEGLLGRIFRS